MLLAALHEVHRTPPVFLNEIECTSDVDAPENGQRNGRIADNGWPFHDSRSKEDERRK